MNSFTLETSFFGKEPEALQTDDLKSEEGGDVTS